MLIDSDDLGPCTPRSMLVCPLKLHKWLVHTVAFSDASRLKFTISMKHGPSVAE